MNDQLGLFDIQCGRRRPAEARRLARRGEQGGSNEAAERVVASGQLGRECQAVLEALRRFPGSTSYELSVNGKLDRYTCGRRLSTLEHKGLAYHVDKEKCPELAPCSITGIRAFRWWPTDSSEVREAA